MTPKYVYVKYVEGPGSVFSMRTDSTIEATSDTPVGHLVDGTIYPKKRAQDALEGRTQPNFESGCVPPRHPGTGYFILITTWCAYRSQALAFSSAQQADIKKVEPSVLNHQKRWLAVRKPP